MEEFKNTQSMILMTEEEFDRKLELQYQKFLQVHKKKPEWIDEKEALELLKLKRTSLWKLRSSGKILYSAISSKHLLYSRSSIMEFIENNIQAKF